MTVKFPVVPRGATISPHLVRTSGDLVSALGGPTQRITRIGSRYAAEVQLPSLDAECAARWLACPLQAEAEGSTLALVMPQMIDASHMLGVTATGAAASNALNYLGPSPKPGMWFSFAHGGRNYLHLVTAVTGTAMKVAPLLRAPLSATPLEFIAPLLEGFCDDTTWSVEYFRFVGHRFTITESA